MADNPEVRLGADITELTGAMGRARTSVQESMGSMRDSFSSVEGAIGKMQGMFAAFAVVVGAGVMFRAAAEEASKLTTEAQIMGEKLGITATEADELATAIGNAYTTTDVFTDSAVKLTKMVKTNEDGLRALGLETRTATGEYKGMKDLMMDSLDVLRKYKEGTDRNLAAQVLYGDEVKGLTDLLNVNNQAVEDATAKQESLGLMIGVEGVERNNAYRAAMNDVGDVMSAFTLTMGKAVMPVITEVGNWFGSIGPDAVMVLRGAIGGLVTTFWGLKNGIVIVWETAKAFIMSMYDSLSMLGSVAVKLMQGDFQGAVGSINASSKSIEDRWSSAGAAMVASSEDTSKKISELFNKDTRIDKKAVTGQDFVDPNKKKAASAKKKSGGGVDTAMLALHVVEQEAELTLTRDNLKRADALYDAAYAKSEITTREYYESKLAIQLSAIDAEISVRKKQVAAAEEQLAKSDAGGPEKEKESIQIKTKLVKLTTDLAMAEAGREEATINSIRNMNNAEQQRANTIAAIEIDTAEARATAAVEGEQNQANAQYDLGIMTKQKLLELERDFEQRKFDIAREAMEAKKQLEVEAGATPEKMAEMHARQEDMELKHQQRMSDIAGKQIAETQRPWLTIFNSMESAVGNALNGILMKTMTMRQAMASVLNSVGQMMITELVTKPLAAKAIAWVKEKMMAMAEISTNAAKAGSGAVSAMAGIPIVGPALAAVAGPATFGAAMAFAGSIASAEQGYDIPRGTNPRVQLHEQEMVLPKAQADVVRNLATKPESADSGHVYVTMNIATPDADSFRKSSDQMQSDLQFELSSRRRGS